MTGTEDAGASTATGSKNGCPPAPTATNAPTALASATDRKENPLGLNHKQAEFYAPQLHHYTKPLDPRLTIGGIINELKAVPNDDPVVIMAAAWATVRKMRAGEYRAFSKLGEEVVNQYPPTDAPAPASSQASYRPYQAQASHQPVSPRLEPECPKHPGQRQTNCGGCKADKLAGEPAYYPTLHTQAA